MTNCGVLPNNRLQWTGTLKVGRASKVLFRSAVLRKRSPAPEPGVRQFGKGLTMRLPLTSIATFIILLPALAYMSQIPRQHEIVQKEAERRGKLYKASRTWDEPPQIGFSVLAATFQTVSDEQLRALYGILVKEAQERSVGYLNALNRALACNPDWAPTIVPPAVAGRKNPDGTTGGFVRIELPKLSEKEQMKILCGCDKKVREYLEKSHIESAWQMKLVPGVQQQESKGK